MKWSVILCVLVALAASVPASAGERVAIGDDAPAWIGLAGADGASHGLEDLKASEVVVVVFTCNRCPVALAYEARFNRFAEDYAERGVSLVAINVNSGESLDEMRAHADEKGFKFAYLRDESQQIARDFGATCTPDIFVLDKDRKVAYMGSFDNKMTRPTTPFVRNAVDALLVGRQPENAV